jgi:CDP-diacylglycerol---glycerol-3-phosphate 3-phosphatidyltransferase
MMLNLPNILTLVRILIIPFFVAIYYLPYTYSHLVASIIFTLACITDWLDGYLARSLKQSTKFGAFLDPVADKMMVSIALVMIVAERQFQFLSMPPVIVTIPAFIITIPAAIIVSREIIVSALREWMAEVGKRRSVVVSSLGKLKTAVQMLALIVLIYCSPSTSANIVFIGFVLLCLAAILTMWSMVIYLKAAWPEFRSETS